MERYITSLKRSQIRLRDYEDELIWDLTTSGIYTPKDGYIKLNLDLVQREPVWWWKKIWKLACPTKSRLFMWNVLTNKVSTWDILQKRNNYGPWRCSLCKSEGESTLHIFLECQFIKDVWIEVSRHLKHRCSWNGLSLEQAWQDWWSNRENKVFRALPLLIIWGVWIARNTLIFNESPWLQKSQQLKVLPFSLHTLLLLRESRLEIFWRKKLINQNLGVFLMELPKTTDAGEEGFYISQTPTILP
jgi:hypothetical protein